MVCVSIYIYNIGWANVLVIAKRLLTSLWV